MCTLERVCCEEYETQSVGSGSWPFGTLAHRMWFLTLLSPSSLFRLSPGRSVGSSQITFSDSESTSWLTHTFGRRKWYKGSSQGVLGALSAMVGPEHQPSPTWTTNHRDLEWSAKFWYGVTCVQVLRNPSAWSNASMILKSGCSVISSLHSAAMTTG